MTKRLGIMLCCLLTVLSCTLFAAHEKTINSLSGVNIQPATGGLYSMNVQDQRWLQMTANPNWACQFGNKQSNVSVVLRLDDSKRSLETVNWTLNVTYDIKLYGLSTTPYITYTGETAAISYNVLSTYNDIYLKTYEGALKAEITITGVSWTPGGGSSQAIPAKYNGDIFLDITQETERYYNLAYNGYNCTPAAIPAPVVTSNITASTINQTSIPNNQLPIAWNYVQGAESYDVEWLFVDIGNGVYTTSYDLDFSRATRVNITGQSFNIPMAYPKGIIVYRVRAVGNSNTAPFTDRVEGPWSADGLTSLTASSSNASSFIKNYDGLDAAYNWQYTAAYAEDGKHKEVASYFDGSLRNRQTTTIINSDDNAVTAETKYDFQGRGSVQLLPTPHTNTGIHFYSNFNPGFSKEQFDIDGNYAGAAIANVPATTATGSYYGSNTSATGSDAYVPDAQGFPYTQTRLKTDGTGRAVEQSGVGPDHTLGMHSTRYVYGTPGGQEELDRLFGNEVGNVSHYKKNMMVDANGQVSVTYLDQEGRTVATALSGTAPANLIALDKPPVTAMVSDMLTNKNIQYGNSRVSKTVLTISAPSTSYTFDYLLNLDTACYSYKLDPAHPENVCKLCEDCVFDLEIRVTDENGHNVAATFNTSSAIYHTSPVTCASNTSGAGIASLLQCSQIEAAHYNITVVFPNIGSYTVEKILTVSQSGISQAIAAFASAVTAAPCGPLTTGHTAPPCNNCDYLCNRQYGAYAPTYVTPGTPTVPAPVTTDKYGTLLSTLSSGDQAQALADYTGCISACNNIGVNVVPDECTLKAQVLFKDMSPGGQYFDNLQDQAYVCTTHPSPDCSPANPSYSQSACINSWLSNMATSNPGFSWSAFYTFATSTSNCTPAVSVSLSTFSDWSWIRNNWQSCFAKYLVQFHPEYCNYKFNCGQTLICDNVKGPIPVFTENATGGLGSTTVSSVTMDNSRLYDKAFQQDAANLFVDPLQYNVTSTPAGYKSNLATSPTVLSSSPVNVYKDPMFSTLIVCDPQIYCTSGYMSTRTYIYNSMQAYFTAPAHNSGGGSIQIPMSIWYVLDDPDNINGITSTSYAITGSSYLASGTTFDQATLDYFHAMHGSSGLLSQAGVTKYDIFRNYYLGQKKFVTYGLYNTNYNCGGDALNGSYVAASAPAEDVNDPGFTSCTYNASTNALPHAQVRFQKNAIFDMMLANCPVNATSLQSAVSTYTAAQLAASFQPACEGKADAWMAEITDKLTACMLGSAASGSTTVLASIRHDLIEICVASSDATNTQGLDHVPASPVDPNLPSGVLSFSDVLNHYLGVSPYNTCTSLISDIHIVNPQPAVTGTPYSQASCTCDNIKNFATDNGITWDLSNTSLPSLIASAMNNNLELPNTITSADVCAWMSQCYAGSGSCLSSTPPLNMAYLNVAAGSGITTQSVPDVLLCPATNEVPPPDPCDAVQANADIRYGDSLMEQQAVNALQALFQANYIQRCLDKLDANEHMTASYNLDEYYFTLYYYDQAGNLIKTVPPEGFRPLVVSQTSNPTVPTTKDVALYRQSPGTNPFVWPVHKLVSNYKYNTLNQVRYQKTPDAGISTFYYDVVGRLAVSQNAKQANYSPPGYSYTLYDDLSRIAEVGELGSSTTISGDLSKDPVFLATFMGVPYSSKRQVTRTYYDEQPQEVLASVRSAIASNKTKGLYASNIMGYLRNRVACVAYIENDYDHSLAYSATTKYYDNASHYSYDIHGNVQKLYQENTDLAAFNYDLNRIDYEYDLISGKVNAVHYNAGKPDQFHHTYQYDADNRITAVYSSRNAVTWEKEAKYFYYKHGPMWRTEVGDKQVQATDYAYTIHGWIKGVNSNSLDMVNDIGLDGYLPSGAPNLNSVFAKDAFGYSLGYYSGDYKAKNNPAASFLASTSAIATNLYPGAPGSGTEGAGLYNGNIANMSASIYLGVGSLAAAPLLRSFRYDQLNRIKNIKSYDGLSSNAWQATATLSDKFRENFTYDYNGNIKHAKRYNDAAANTDDIDYDYTYAGSDLVNNQLNDVVETSGIAAGTYAYDVDGQAAGNYTYDEIGNLKADAAEEIDHIDWTVYGKIKRIVRTSSSTKPDIEYVYDATGVRIEKIVKPHATLGTPSTFIVTYYLRDALGSPMAIYGQTLLGSTLQLTLQERNIHGSSHLGVVQTNDRMDVNTEVAHQTTFGNAASTDGWSAVGGAISVDASNRLEVDVPASGLYTGTNYSSSGFLAGHTYEVSFDMDRSQVGTNDLGALVLDNPSSGVYIEIAKITPVQGFNAYRFTARSATTIIKFQNNTGSNPAFSFYVDNITVKEVSKSRTLGQKRYEMSNYLQNVVTIISDRKLPIGSGTTTNYYMPEILSTTDYYAFGQPMPGRQLNSNIYRYGFNNQEKDDEISGVGNHNSAFFGELDTRLGRRWNLDPKPNASSSMYSVFLNNPIYHNDIALDTPKIYGNAEITKTTLTDKGGTADNIGKAFMIRDAKLVPAYNKEGGLVGYHVFDMINDYRQDYPVLQLEPNDLSSFIKNYDMMMGGARLYYANGEPSDGVKKFAAAFNWSTGSMNWQLVWDGIKQQNKEAWSDPVFVTSFLVSCTHVGIEAYSGKPTLTYLGRSKGKLDNFQAQGYSANSSFNSFFKIRGATVTQITSNDVVRVIEVQTKEGNTFRVSYYQEATSTQKPTIKISTETTKGDWRTRAAYRFD